MSRLLGVPDIVVADFDAPIGNLVLRNGKHLPIQRADLGTVQIGQRMEQDPTNMELQYACLRRVLPTGTEEDFADLTAPVIQAVIQRALYGVTEVADYLGESSGAGLASSSGSPPETPTPTSAAVSPPIGG